MTTAEQTTRGFNILFIHSSLDDAGLTPTEFRVFAHLSRRAGEGTAFAAAESMAAACRISRDTVWEALKELERRRMITREKRPGQTTLIKLAKPADWLLDPAETKGRPLKPVDPYIPPGGGGNEGPRVAETKGHEGNPLRQSKEGHPPKAEEVFEAWNKLEGFPKSLVLSDERRRRLTVRLRDSFFAENWRAALTKVQASRFCMGESERGWKADFDWFLQPAACVKIMEGKYDGKSPPPPASAAEFCPGWENKDFWSMTEKEKQMKVRSDAN